MELVGTDNQDLETMYRLKDMVKDHRGIGNLMIHGGQSGLILDATVVSLSHPEYDIPSRHTVRQSVEIQGTLRAARGGE